MAGRHKSVRGPAPRAAHPGQEGAAPPPAAAKERGKRASKAGRRGGAAKSSRSSTTRPGELWLYGRHPVEAALLNPARRLRRLLGTGEALAALDGALARSPHAPVIDTVDRSLLDDLLGPGTVHQGLALRADPLPASAIEDVIARAQGRDTAVALILDQVTDPHNVGAILRSASAFGALAVIVQDRHSPEETGVLAKSASGALERVPVVRVPNLTRAIAALRDAGFWTAGLAADAPVTLAGARLSGHVALALGSEGEGLRRLTRESCDHLVRLPMAADAVESLNVSNAAAVALYELVRENLER